MANESPNKNPLSLQYKFYFLIYDRNSRNKKRTYQMEGMKNYLSFFVDDKLYKSVFSYIYLRNHSRINFNRKEDDTIPTKRSFTDEDFKNKNKINVFVGKKSYDI